MEAGSDWATKINLFFRQGGMIPRYLQGTTFLQDRISREAESRISYKN